MGAFTVQLSTRINGVERKYPHALNGQPRVDLATGEKKSSVRGVDRGAAEELRRNQKPNGDLVMSRDAARKIAKALTDGGRVAASEKPAYYAALAAAKGDSVEITDNSGHWRTLKATKAGKKAFFDGVRGTHMSKPATATRDS